MTKSKNYINQFLFVFLALLCLISPFFSVITATNAEDIYSNVLTDLQKDETFNVADYPVIEDDYSLQVIQIAESKDKELLIYVYQPSGQSLKLLGTSINISYTEDDTLLPDNYKLTLLSSNDTLFKYSVEGLVVRDEEERIYNIFSILRKFEENIDEEATGDNKISEVAYKVGKVWVAKTKDDNVTYSNFKIDVITITDKYVGFIRYRNGFSLMPNSCDGHFVAFSTDRLIDELIEADVYYTYQRWTAYKDVSLGTGGGYIKSYDDKTPVEARKNLTNEDLATIVPDGIGGTYREWKRIVSVDDFIKDESSLSDSAKKELAGKKWVLRFLETEYGVGIGNMIGTDVNDVMILRLKFQSYGLTFDLGVVDNKQTGSRLPSNYEPFDFLKWLRNHVVEFLLILFAGIVIVMVIVSLFFKGTRKILGFVLRKLWEMIKLLFKGIWYILTLPWQLLD